MNFCSFLAKNLVLLDPFYDFFAPFWVQFNPFISVCNFSCQPCRGISPLLSLTSAVWSPCSICIHFPFSLGGKNIVTDTILLQFLLTSMPFGSSHYSTYVLWFKPLVSVYLLPALLRYIVTHIAYVCCSANRPGMCDLSHLLCDYQYRNKCRACMAATQMNYSCVHLMNIHVQIVPCLPLCGPISPYLGPICLKKCFIQLYFRLWKYHHPFRPSFGYTATNIYYWPWSLCPFPSKN